MRLCAQVWGIGFEDRAVYFRQGVTASELSGKAWKVVSVPRDSERSHSSASASSLQRLVSFMSLVDIPCSVVLMLLVDLSEHFFRSLIANDIYCQ